MSFLVNTRERTRFIRFAIVGTIGAFVDFGVFNLLATVIGLQAVVAQFFSFLTAVISNFTWNRYWTYPDSRSKPVARQLIQYTFINAIGLAIRTPLFAFLGSLYKGLIEKISLPLPIGAETLGNNLALGTVMVVILFWNFFANRYWTYGDVE